MGLRQPTFRSVLGIYKIQFMSSPRRFKNKQEVDVADLYAVKMRAVWAGLTEQHISFWMLCIYFFFEYVRPQTLYPSLDIIPWTQIALIATLLTVFFNKSIKWVASPVNKLLILFCFILVFSGIFAFMPALAWDNRNVMLGWVLVYFLTINIVNSEKRLIIFLLAYFLFNFKMSQHGAIEWTLRGFSFTGWGLVGAPGWFHNSGEYAIQMLIFGSLAIAFVYSLKDYWGKYKKWFFYAAAATGYMAVMGASSRGAQLALLSIGVWVLLRQKWGIKGLVVILLISAALYTVLPDEQIQRFKEIGSDPNSLQRLAYWEYGLTEVIPKFPFLGVGYNNWLSYVSFMVPEGMGPHEIVQQPHNIFIMAASELGITGLLIFLLLITYAFIVNARTRVRAKYFDNRLIYNLTYGLDAGLIGYLVAGSFVTVLYYPFFWIQIAMIVMINSIASRMALENQQLQQPKT